ncbi:putative inactive protein kinase At3g63330 isoform X2 [Wolffia australiana]
MEKEKEWKMLEASLKIGVVLPESMASWQCHGLLVMSHIRDNNEGRLSTSLISMDFFHQIERKFQKLLVKADYRKSCFYLAEELKESSDLVFISPKAGKTHEHNDIVPYLLEGQTSDASMWPLNIYDEKGTCLDIDLGSDNAEGHCVSRESLVNFFGLLNSIPFNDWGSHLSDSFNQKNSDFRYTLKRKFDRGSYGEVWLAYHWNCSEETLGANLHPNIYNASSPLHSHVDKSGADPESSEKSNYDYFILKRIMVERGNAAYLSGLREKYYGEIFANASKLMKQSEESASGTASYTVRQSVVGPYIYGTESMIYEEGLNHIARFVESFISESKETWLVFRHEGISLSKLLYTVDEREVLQSDDGDRMSSNVQVLHPSAWWNWLRTTEAGKGEIRNIMRQLLLAIKSCHRRGITHRDIKPENMIVCFEDINSGKCERVTPTRQNSHPARVRIIDFGSAVDEFTLKNLYGSGPSRLEQTYEYTPPEALLNATWFKAETRTTMKYDIWSAGVVFLELILGSPHVFQISDRTRAMLDQHLEGWGDSMKELAYKLRSLMEMCILIPGLPSQQHHDERRRQEGVSWPASWKCTEESFASLVKNRDPLKLGFPNIWALRLVRQLLAWHPEERISIDEALQHPYFESDL